MRSKLPSTPAVHPCRPLAAGSLFRGAPTGARRPNNGLADEDGRRKTNATDGVSKLTISSCPEHNKQVCGLCVYDVYACAREEGGGCTYRQIRVYELRCRPESIAHRDRLCVSPLSAARRPTTFWFDFVRSERRPPAWYANARNARENPYRVSQI